MEKKQIKNVVFAQVVKGINKARKVSYSLMLSVVVKKDDKDLILPFKQIYLSEYESLMVQDFCGVAEGKNLNNPNIKATIKRGTSQKGNVYYVFDVSVFMGEDEGFVRFKQSLLSDFERITLVKRCGFDLTDIETTELLDEVENLGA